MPKTVFLDASGNIVAANGSNLTALNASNLASGVYLVRAEAAGQVSFEKLMLLK